jgi:hypothetical protein
MLRWGVSAAAGVTSPLMNAFATAPADWLPNDQSTGSPTSRPTDLSPEFRAIPQK